MTSYKSDANRKRTKQALLYFFGKHPSMNDNDQRSPSATKCTCDPTNYINAIYISSSAVIGATLRVYLSRLLGEDCELGDDAVQDFLTPFFRKICVTAGGTTIQTGGALFRDLPANLLGSFLMGLVTSNQHTSPFPWYSKDHPIQLNTFLHIGFGVGLCGCLTTFSSWNTQMVVMMDGSYTELGPQIVPALFGYILGMTGSVTSFKIGREASSWLYLRSNSSSHNDDSNGMENKDNDIRPEGQDNYPIDSTREPKVNPTYKYVRPVHLLHLFAFLAIGLNLVGQCVFQNPFYKNMTAAVVIAPVGALTRWKLSTLNGSNYVRGFMSWLPWGTLLANILAAIISIICQGLSDRYGKVWNDSNPWLESFLFAIKVGFAGSLSTVSTLVKEVANLQQSYPGSAKFVIYSIATLTGGMIFSLFVYMMIVRI